MRFDVVSLLPALFGPFLQHGVIGRACSAGSLEVHFWDPRQFDPGGQADDAPYGGGAGMVLCAEPLARAVEAARADAVAAGWRRPATLFLDPAGERLTQGLVRELAEEEALALVCGRYEGVDQRAVEELADRTVSLGDFVLSGGEVAAMSLIEAVGRLRPGVLGNPRSSERESFAADAQYGAPAYTRPRAWRGREVPADLLSGDHRRIRRWSEDAAARRSKGAAAGQARNQRVGSLGERREKHA